MIGLGVTKQTDISTVSLIGNIVRIPKINADALSPSLVCEDDADEIGKGHEFATAIYPAYWDCKSSLEKYTSSEIVAWACGFGMGKVSTAGTTPNFTHTITPLDPVTDGLELPYFSYVQQIRPGASDILDQVFIGCAINDFTISLTSAPSRANSRITINFIASGKITEPSTLSLPTVLSEHAINASSLVSTINGVDYVTAKNMVELEWGWRNNFDTTMGYYPGCGTQNGGAIMGRIQVGKREAFLNYTARFEDGSTEYTKLKALTTGTATVTETNDTNNTYTAMLQKVAFRTVELGNTNGIVTVRVSCSCLYDPTNKVISVTAKCPIDKIAQTP